MWLIFLSAAFTALAGFLTALLFGRNRSVWGKTHAEPAEVFPPCEEEQEENTEPHSSQETLPGLREPRAASEYPAQTTEDLPDEPCPSNQQEIVEDQSEQAVKNDESSSAPSVNRMDDEDQTLKYMPGRLRTSQLEKMMSKEELEEEQRVQREQLAAIFKLLKENQDTFGEVTEKDMEEQLKLYSI
ncbi:matrix-remodeling-associated protein 7-like [Neoarius graeffei]|uniref:matrix-remodeling-associated protein 7-like n=1 Tax=Neoarius graeffei TaxID=443677 RepID=UPI00298CF2D1|nr:matrix-remodeling-associated protein 7-like [Neoarius graeffei]